MQPNLYTPGENWALKNWCFSTVVLKKPLESLLDCKEIPPVHPKGNQSCILIRRTDAEAETPILWLPNAKNWPFGKDSDAGKDWRQEEKGMTEGEMVAWHHRLDGHEFEQAPMASHMMYSAHKLNKQGDKIQPWRTPFPIWQRAGHDWGCTHTLGYIK